MTSTNFPSVVELNFVRNPLNPELNPICHLLVLLGAHHILHVNRIRVNSKTGPISPYSNPVRSSLIHSTIHKSL